LFSSTRLRACVCAGVASALFLSGTAKAEIFLLKKDKPNDWEVSTNGRVDAYLNWIGGESMNTVATGNLVDPSNPAALDRYTLVGPQIQIRGNPIPGAAMANATNDKDLNTFRIRGGFASTILAFNVYKQVLPDVKLTIKLALWAGIQNGTGANNSNPRQFNDAASVDFREQYMDLSGSWGSVWGGRRIGLYNRGGMRMNWFLIHQHGVGHPCDVDSNAAATCGHTGVGSMFPSRHAQLGYATPNLGGVQLSLAALDPAMIDGSWNRTIAPRFEGELVFRQEMTARPVGKDEINLWANGLTQMIGRVGESPRNLPDPGVPADSVRNVWGVGGGAWGRFVGFGIGATGWYGQGLGTAWALGNTAIDNVGQLRTHFGYLAAVNYRISSFEVAGSYGSTNAKETNWDASRDNPLKQSVIKEVRGIGYKLAYHMEPVVFSIDGMILRYQWHRGEVQNANTVSGGMLAEW
jgi:hypothetical protein